MELNVPFAEHYASLPYCYYDRYQEKVILRLVSSADVIHVTVIYGDPFETEKSGGFSDSSWVWRHERAALEGQYRDAARIVWRTGLKMPRRRRMKYGFVLETAEGAFYFAEKEGIAPYTGDSIKDNFNFFFFPFIHEVDAPSVPEWAPDTVWYQIFPERFYNGDPSISPEETSGWETGKPEHYNFFGGDLAGIRQKLGHLKELGVNGIYLTPVFSAPSNHKYDTTDYFTVDSHFGTKDDLKALVAEAHRAGIRVMLDAVFNHIGASHPFWQNVLKNQEKSAYRDYFHIHSFPVREKYRDRFGINYDTFAFVANMPKWNTENSQARKYLIDAAVYWIKECDIDAWRLDVSDEVSLDFWREFSRSVREAKADCYVLGEMWHDASNWLNPGYFSAAMNYPLGFAVTDFFLKKTSDRKAGAFAFTGKLTAALSRYSELHTRAAFNLLDSHDTPRALTVAKGDKLALRNAFTMLFLLPGSPCIFYGTEIGMEGENDTDSRRPMIWDEKRQDRELLAFFRDLIAFRKDNIAIINSCSMRYEAEKGVSRWIIGAGENTLRAVYTGEKPVEAGGETGECVLSAAPINNGKIPPFTLAVFYK
ncbi:MAG: glycoside hydrolase family 13 protein [Spirochaetaceae bacterium]|jgi:glycosidase|nr:glycoside hydrolase family 13 protein [Spirochaetaceae bacterium]